MNNLKKIILYIFISIIVTNLGYSNSDKYHLSTQLEILDTHKPDFSNIFNLTENKSIFIMYMLGTINDANAEIFSERKQIVNAQNTFNSNEKLSSTQLKTIEEFKKYYKVNTKGINKTVFTNLLTKVDTLPKSMVIAQAILESGWGSSRCAVNYNNYFGLHCFDDNYDVKAKGADVYMERFKNVGDSVLGYYYRINTGDAFKELRDVRENTKCGKGQVKKIINALGNHSALKDNQYQGRLNSLIKYNDLEKYDINC